MATAVMATSVRLQLDCSHGDCSYDNYSPTAVGLQLCNCSYGDFSPTVVGLQSWQLQLWRLQSDCSWIAVMATAVMTTTVRLQLDYSYVTAVTATLVRLRLDCSYVTAVMATSVRLWLDCSHGNCSYGDFSPTAVGLQSWRLQL